ncbi:uncharacterized protein [Bos indicus]|uniref:Uncharacterized protein n=1 Tax=Bos indicus TaxID=9915 RepID=A0ABM4S010_BOSIN
MPIFASWQMSLELALEEVVAVDPSSSTYHRQPIRVFPALTAVSSASVLVGRSVGHPLTIPVVGPTPATRRLLFPVQPTSLLSHPHPAVPLPTASPQRNAQPGGRHLPHRHHCRTITVWHVSPAMSATEEHDWIPGGKERAGGWAGRDPSLLGVQASACEGTEGVEEATALLASLEVSRALPGEQGWPQAAVEEECGREPLEESEMEEDVEMQEDKEESEIDFELEDVEEEEHLSGEGEEEEDENEQEGAAVVAGLGFCMDTFGPLFQGHLDSFLRNFRNNRHVLFWPHADRLMARGCSQPPSDAGEGPVPPQEQEDLGEGGRVLQGLDSAAGFKLGYFPCQLLTPMSASFCPNDEGEDQYENTDEEEEDGNEKPEGL